MAPWDSLIRFAAADGTEYWAALPLETVPAAGLTVQGYSTIDKLESGSAGTAVTVSKVCLNPKPGPLCHEAMLGWVVRLDANLPLAPRSGARHRHPHHLHWSELP